MDAGRYAVLKTKGAVKLIKVPGGNVMCFVQRFDPETGDETTPESSILQKKQLLEMRAKMVESLAGLDALIADVDKTVTE